jgi:hypothetical protein
MRCRKRARVAIIVIFFLFSTYGYGAQEDFVYPEEFDRDPFEPLINAEGIINVKLVRQFGDLELNGIIYSSEEADRRAIINNTLVKKDEFIGTYKVDQITADSVLLSRKGKQISLTIKKEE